MELTGWEPTMAELEAMAVPYGINHGEEWTFQSIAGYINAGMDQVEKDPAVAAELKAGLESLLVARNGRE